MSASPGEVTELLRRINAGQTKSDAMQRLVPLVYDELRALADSFLRRERSDHTLQPTALVNEAYMRLVDQRKVGWESRGHFMAVAATAMRRVLVHHARARKRLKRGGDRQRQPLDGVENRHTLDDLTDVDIDALNDALLKLAEVDSRKVQVVEMRFFAGCSVEETAKALNCSVATVKRDWQLAKSWLFRELHKQHL